MAGAELAAVIVRLFQFFIFAIKPFATRGLAENFQAQE